MPSRHKPDHVLLHTKLNRPGVTKDLVVRPRLLKLLDSGFQGPLTLVVAPAGFGKTTLISSWVRSLGDGYGEDRMPIPTAWLALDEDDGDRDVFIRYLIAALRTSFPNACARTLDLLNARRQPPAGLVNDILSNELESLPTRFVVVLDDLNAPYSQGVIDCLTDWMRHWPRPMHLVLLSRFNPSLPLAALRARGQLTEIRSRDLRFSPAETTEYFRRALERPLDETTIAILQQSLEGWIAGLKMAGLSLREQSDAQTLTAALLGGNVHIADYLIEEVLNRQPPALQLFLLKASIVDQFCASLCDTLMGGRGPESDARDCINQLETADLFLTKLDNRREWYRFHHLLRDLLRQKLATAMTPAEVCALHIRAAHWFAEHNLLESALHHALEANDLDLAAQFMWQGLCDVLNGEDLATLRRWLGLLPEKSIRQNPYLQIMQAWDHGFRWELDLLARSVEWAEALADKADQSEAAQLLRGQIAALKGQAAFQANQHDRAAAYCRDALALLPQEWRYVRGVASIYMGMSLYAAGHTAEAEKYLLVQYEAARDKTGGYALRLLLALATNFLQAGYYESAERTARALLRQATQSQLTVMQGWGHYFLGFVHYQWNDLDGAAQQFAAVSDLSFTTQWVAARNGLIGQALTAQALGRGGDAREAIDRLGRIDLGYRGREESDTAAARARLMYMQGDLEGAGRWADLYTAPPVAQPLLPWMEEPQLTRARILIARNKADDVRAALQTLDTMLAAAERTFNVRITIEVLSLRALAQLAQGDSDGACHSLIRAVELARRGVFTRVFLDLGPQMQKLLYQIAGHAPTAITVNRLLAAFPGAPAPATANGSAVHLPPTPNGDSDERLTPRELEVLLLMAEPISLKVIAARLNISYATTRRYTINIYDKFSVHSRWEAVDAAIRKGIVLPR